MTLFFANISADYISANVQSPSKNLHLQNEPGLSLAHFEKPVLK
jgi:hypothetical protein